MPLGQQPDQPVLGVISVLILIHHDVAPQLLIGTENHWALQKEPDGLHQEVVKIEGPVPLQRRLVSVIDPGHPLFEVISRLGGKLCRGQEIVLGAADPGPDHPGMDHSLAQIQLLQALPKESELIALIVDEKRGTETQVLGVFSQDLDTRGVKGPHPDVQPFGP